MKNQLNLLLTILGLVIVISSCHKKDEPQPTITIENFANSTLISESQLTNKYYPTIIQDTIKILGNVGDIIELPCKALQLSLAEYPTFPYTYNNQLEGSIQFNNIINTISLYINGIPYNISIQVLSSNELNISYYDDDMVNLIYTSKYKKI